MTSRVLSIGDAHRAERVTNGTADDCACDHVGQLIDRPQAQQPSHAVETVDVLVEAWY
jgi:hypothetical protein